MRTGNEASSTPAPSVATMSEGWPFTPEVKGRGLDGGWMVGHGDGDVRAFYYLDPDWHRPETDEQIAANTNLIAAAPRMYRALKRLHAAIETEADIGDEYGEALGHAADVIDWIDQR